MPLITCPVFIQVTYRINKLLLTINFESSTTYNPRNARLIITTLRLHIYAVGLFTIGCSLIAILPVFFRKGFLGFRCPYVFPEYRLHFPVSLTVRLDHKTRISQIRCKKSHAGPRESSPQRMGQRWKARVPPAISGHEVTSEGAWLPACTESITPRLLASEEKIPTLFIPLLFLSFLSLSST